MTIIGNALNAARKGVSTINKNARKIGTGLVALGATAAAHAQATGVDAIVEDVEGITAKASTGYIAAAGLGVAALVVGTLVYMSKRGWKLR